MTLLTADSARKLSDPARFGTHTFVDESRLTWLRDAIAKGSLPARARSKWIAIRDLPSTWTVTGVIDPWFLPENYGEDGETFQESIEKIHQDFQAACGYAFRYRLYGNEADASNVANILLAYSSITTFEANPGSTLNWWDGWGLLVQAATMIKTAPIYSSVDAPFRAVLNRALTTLEPIGYTRPNNWGAWGIAMEIAVSGFLQDRIRFDSAIKRWRTLFNETVFSNYTVDNGGLAQGQIKNNVPIREIYRMGPGQGNGAYGLVYSAFHLDGMTIAAEWARINGEWLFDHVSPDGSSLKGLWEEVAHQKRYGAPGLSTEYKEVQWYNTSWAATPGSTYYYNGFYTNRVGGGFYILQSLWPLETARELMYGGFWTLEVRPEDYPPTTVVRPPAFVTGYAITQDYYGMYGADILYTDRPLY